MLFIYLNNIIEKNMESETFSKFQFSMFKNFSSGQFWGASAHKDIAEFQNFLSQLKNQRSRSKTVCGFFYHFYLERSYRVLKSRVHVFY